MVTLDVLPAPTELDDVALIHSGVMAALLVGAKRACRSQLLLFDHFRPPTRWQRTPRILPTPKRETTQNSPCLKHKLSPSMRRPRLSRADVAAERPRRTATTSALTLASIRILNGLCLVRTRCMMRSVRT